MNLQELRRIVFGAPLDPLNPKARQHIVLLAFLAWVGLGADGLSSACYGPEEAFLALGEHGHLGLYLATATALTVFIISIAYNQVIELFPSGGGGYKVATSLIGPHAGLVSGAALIVDYVLTIAISAASGMDALFSLLPPGAASIKLAVELALVALLIFLNMRGMKESIQVLLPIFLVFFITHFLLIVYGIAFQGEHLPDLVPDTFKETGELMRQHGWVFVAALFLRAYSLGGGTYTGLEAVSNNVHMLAEPRVRTGKLTMLYMALSLSFTAGGIILLYLLWNAKPVTGQTLNAVTFQAIIQSLNWESPVAGQVALLVTLASEGGLLFVASNTGFLGGPAVLANMAADSWMPNQFRHLSNRLVTQNGILIMGLAALGILLWSGGKVALLVVLYSINVFLTFSLSLLGLCIYWWRRRGTQGWRSRLLLSATGLSVTASILVVTTVEKFAEGGWVTMLITGVVITCCLGIKSHYEATKAQLRKADELFGDQFYGSITNPPQLDPEKPTAVFMVGSSRGGAMHALLWVRRLWPEHYKNFVFLSAREVDAQSFGGAEELATLRQRAISDMHYYVNFCHSHGLAAKYDLAFGTDTAEEMTKLALKVREDFPNCVFFTSKLVFERENWLIRQLHNQTALAMQSRLHLQGIQMVILPMRI